MESAHWSTYNIFQILRETLTLVEKVAVQKDTDEILESSQNLKKQLEQLSNWLDSETKSRRDHF